MYEFAIGVERAFVFRLSFVAILDLEGIYRLPAFLVCTLHDAVAVHFHPFERPERLEDFGLSVGAPDRPVGPTIERYPLVVGRERPVHGRPGIGSGRWFRSRARPDVGDAAAVEGEALLQRQPLDSPP